MTVAGLNVMNMLRDQLKLKQLEIETLLEITTAINTNESAEYLFQLFEKTLRDQINIERLILFSFNGTWKDIINYGNGNSTQLISVEKDLMPFKKLTLLKNTQRAYLSPYDILIPVYHKEKPLAFLLMSSPMVESYEPVEDRIKFARTITNIIIVAIENKRLFKQEVAQEAFKRELEVAAQVQSMLIPDKLPNNNEVKMAAIYLPQVNVGGDYYDAMYLNDDEFFFCIADISGKGIAAALLMANFQAQLRALIKKNHPTIDEFFQELNRVVLLSTRGEKFITLFLGKYNKKTRILKYINAGHNPPLLASPKGIRSLDSGCTILGMFDKLPSVKMGQIPIIDDTTILCYTDGLTDLVNESNQIFSLEELTQFLLQHKHEDVDLINRNLLTSIMRFKESQNFVDDITVLTVKILGK